MFRNLFTGRAVIPLFSGILAFLFYFFCLSPTLTYGGDCGELIAASWIGGIPHPTGYALFATSGWLFAHLLPLGEVAWRYSLFSALMGSVAVALVAATVQRLTQNKFAALTAALSLAGCYLFASQSVIAEVYALNAALISLIFYAAICWKQDRRWFWLALVAVCVGLIPNSHLSSIYLLPGLVLFLWPSQPKVLFKQHSKRLVGLGLLVLLGFSLTLYLPWRARQFPAPASGPGGTLIYQPQDWGHPATLQSWWNHITAKQYRGLLWKNQAVHVGSLQFSIPTFTQPLSHAAMLAAEWLGMVALQYLWLILFTAIGAIFCWKLMPRLGWLLWPAFILNLFFQSNYNVKGVADITNFLFPCYIVIALWTGIGYHAASKVLLRWNPKKQKLGRLALEVLAISAIAVQWIIVYPAINHHKATRARDTALERAAAVENLQEKTGKTVSALMWHDDTLFPFWYAQCVLGKAAAAQTPWGPYRHYYWDNGRKMDLVKKLHRQGPLVVAEWDPQINAAFPLKPLNKSGTLWLASDRALPEPAKVLSGSRNQKPELQIPQDIKAGELFAATLEFDFDPSQNQQIIKRDISHDTLQVGWVEIAYLPTNAPFNVQRVSQRIPFVIPNGLKDSARLQMILPLQVPRTFPESTFDLWFHPPQKSWQKKIAVPLIH